MCQMFLYGIVIATLVFISNGQDGDGDIKTKVLSKPEECTVKAQSGDEVTVHYISKLKDGTVLKTTYGTQEPAVFVIGEHKVLTGLEYGIIQMCVGEKRYLEIPPKHAYGEEGKPPSIPPMSEIIIEAEVMEIRRNVLDIQRYLNDKRVWFAGYAAGLAIIILFIICKCLPNLPSQKRKTTKAKKVD